MLTAVIFRGAGRRRFIGSSNDWQGGRMIWTTDDGRHEGYLVPEFGDGQRGLGIVGSGLPEDQIVVSARGDGSGAASYTTRPASEVIGWRVICNCRDERDAAPSSESQHWESDLLPRVTFPHEHSFDRGLIFATDDEVATVVDRESVNDLAEGIWSFKHVRRTEAVQALQEARRQLALANGHLDRAIAHASYLGVDALTIERAAGIGPLARRRRPSEAPPVVDGVRARIQRRLRPEQ